MRGSDHPTCVECLAPIQPHDDHIVLLGGAEDGHNSAHRHALCEDFANFLTFNFKSGRTIPPGQVLRGWETIERFYEKMDVRDLPNAYMRGKDIYSAIMRARKNPLRR